MTTDSVRRLFPQLLKNGYVPIPNRDKACYLPKWPSIEVNDWQCRQWARQMRWPAIGLRVEPPLLVLDFDLPDAGIANAVRAITPKIVREWALERQGNAPKTAFFLRMDEADEPFRELHTRRYHFQGSPKPAFAVQAFAGGGGGAQFGAFGPHSHDEDGRVVKTYSWIKDRSPATVPLDKLPTLRRDEVTALVDAADKLLASWPGLVLDETSTLGAGGQKDVHDLTEATVFTDVEGVVYSYDDLVIEAKARQELKQPVMRITGSFTGDKTSSGSPRCKVYWSKTKGLTIVDFKTGTTHHPLLNSEDPELQQMLAEIFTKRSAK